MLASETCYRPGQDIVMPVFTKVADIARSPHLSAAPPPPRTTLFHWRGQTLFHFPKYSFGIRQQVAYFLPTVKVLVRHPPAGNVLPTDRHASYSLLAVAPMLLGSW